MKKLSLLLLLFCGTFAQAQTGPKAGKLSPAFNIATEMNLPFQNYVLGLGASLGYEAPLSSRFSLNVSAGYNAMFMLNIVWNVDDETTTIGFIPLRIGGRYYATSKFYLEGTTGTAIRLDSGNSALIAGGGGGFVFKLRDGGGLDLGLKAEHWEGQVDHITFKIAYRFPM